MDLSPRPGSSTNSDDTDLYVQMSDDVHPEVGAGGDSSLRANYGAVGVGTGMSGGGPGVTSGNDGTGGATANATGARAGPAPRPAAGMGRHDAFNIRVIQMNPRAPQRPRCQYQSKWTALDWLVSFQKLWSNVASVLLFLCLRYMVLAFVLTHLLGTQFVVIPFLILWLSEASMATSTAILAYQPRLSLFRAIFMAAMGCISISINVRVIIAVNGFREYLFREPDGTINIDWRWLNAVAIAFNVATGMVCFVSAVVLVCVIGWAVVAYARKFCCCLRCERGADGRAPLHAVAAYVAVPNERFMPRLLPSWCVSDAVAQRMGAVLPMFLSCAPTVLALSWLLVAIGTYFSAMYGVCDAGDLSCHSGCDGLDMSSCMYPYPSSFFLRNDTTTETGYRVHISSNAMPAKRGFDQPLIDPEYWNEADGFSVLAPLLCYIPDATMLGVPNTHANIGAFNESGVRTVIINAETGERHPHFVEIDIANGNGTSPTIILQPAQPMNFATRYVVGIAGFVNSKWEVLPPTPGFVRLRDSHLPAERAGYFAAHVFPVLEADGFVSNSSALQLAWDFVTVSRQNLLGRTEMVRDTALKAVGPEATIKYRISKIVPEKCSASNPARHPRIVWGYATVPYFLDSKWRGSIFPRDHGSRPFNMSSTGSFEAGFVVMLPCSLLQPDSPPAVSVVQFGHGLFGTRAQAVETFMQDLAYDHRWLVLASDWYGMSRFDILTAAKVLLAAPGGFATIPESIAQGWANKAVLLRFARRHFASTSVLMRNPHTLMPVVNASTPVAYYGVSQGSILGGGYVSYSPDLHLAALVVPGTPFAGLLSRSLDFRDYEDLMVYCFGDFRDVRLALTLMQQLWDASETAGWLTSVHSNRSPGLSDKRFLLQAAYGDSEVTTIGAKIMARSLGARSIEPVAFSAYGISPADPPLVADSGFVEWNFTFVKSVPFGNIPAPSVTDTHVCVSQLPPAMRQVGSFLSTGIIEQFCPAGEACQANVCCGSDEIGPRPVGDECDYFAD